MMCRVNEIRPALEALHGEPTSSQRCHKRERPRGFAAASYRTGYHEGFHSSISTLPLSASGSPANIISTLSAIAATLWLISPSNSRNRTPPGKEGTTPLQTSLEPITHHAEPTTTPSPTHP